MKSSGFMRNYLENIHTDNIISHPFESRLEEAIKTTKVITSTSDDFTATAVEQEWFCSSYYASVTIIVPAKCNYNVLYCTTK